MIANRRRRRFSSEGLWLAATLSALSIRCAKLAPDEPSSAEGGAAAAEGGAPRTEGGAPRTEGGVPQAQGGAPRTEGGVPQAQGGAQQAQGGAQQAQGGAQQAEGGTDTRGAPLRLRPERSVLVTDPAVLQGLTLERVLFKIAGEHAHEVYLAFAFSFLPREDAPNEPGPRCDDEAPARDGFSTLNGHPVPCPAEAQGLLRMNENKVWKPLSVTNRFDLAPDSGDNCGEQHVSYFLDRGGGLPEFPVQAALRFSAVIANPAPELGLEGCRPIVDFWASMSEREYDSPATRAAALELAFLGTPPESNAGEAGRAGELGFAAFLSPEHFGKLGRLQLLYLGDRGIWHFFEHELSPTDDYRVIRKPLSQALPVFDLLSHDPTSNPCVPELLGAVSGLLDDDPAALRMNVSPRCFAGAEQTESPTLLNGVRGIVPGADYGTELARLFERELSLSYPRYGFNAFDIAARADFAGTCSGCHYLKDSLLSNPGTIAHVNHDRSEPCAASGADGERSCYATSPILKLSFLPRWTARLQGFWSAEAPPPDDLDEP